MHYKNKSLSTKKKAFTLIELLIVIAIIGILFIVLISKVDFATDKAKATGVQTDFRSFQVAIETVAKENAGLATFGWDTGDTNGNRVRDSYDKGDTNKNGKQDPGEVFVGSKTYGEEWTNIYTLTNPADANDKSAITALEAAINKNLDPKLHITINDDYTITMSNSAKDPWNTEYHGYYITNAVNDNKDRGAIVLYSNGANQEFGSEHSVANGVVTVNVPGNNVYGKDDYSMAVIYTYVNGYGEVKTVTTGFSNNQGGGQAGTGETIANPDDIYSKTYKFANNINANTLEELWEKSISDTKDDGYVILIDNDTKYLELYIGDSGYYGLYYSRFKYGMWYGYDYYTDVHEVDQLGWHNTDGEYILCPSPYISFTEDDEIYTVNGVSDLMPLLIEAEEPQSKFQIDVPYITDFGYVVFKHDGTFISFYDISVSNIIEGGNDIPLQMVDLNNCGYYEWYMDAYNVEWIYISNGNLELEVSSLIKSDKTYHDVFDSEMYTVLLMNCSETGYYNRCDFEITISLMYNNGKFVDKNANNYNDLNGMYIYNNLVFNEYNEPIGYVSMDGQYIEIYDDCNHYFLSKKGNPSRTQNIVPCLNEYGFYENSYYTDGYEEVVFLDNGRADLFHIESYYREFFWSYDSEQKSIVVTDTYGNIWRTYMVTENANEISEIGYGNSIILTRDESWQRQGYLLETEYYYEIDDKFLIFHADGSATIEFYDRVITVATNMLISGVHQFEAWYYNVTISNDGNYIEYMYGYE